MLLARLCVQLARSKNIKAFVCIVAALSWVGSCLGQTRNPALPLAIPFDYATNQIFLRVSVNGSDAIWFILDSGASACVIDNALAQKLGIKIESEQQGTGAGKGTVKMSITKAVTYNLPGVDVPVEESYVIDLSGQLALLGRYVGGILGYSFFARYVVDVDFDARVITLYDPEQYHPDGEAIPFKLVKHTPHIDVKLAVAGRPPTEVEVLVDSGSQDAIDADLLGQSRQRLEVVGGVGLGQEFQTVLGRADSLQVGSYTLHHLYGATGGTGLIGNEILRRFHLAFDYAHERLVLSPGSHFSDPFLLDASGLDLRWAPGFTAFEVHDVAKDSPAWAVGIRQEDEIVAINGQPASAFTMEQVSELLTESGREIWLSVKRGPTTKVIKVALRQRL